ncbi:hypothetical protein SAEN111111_06125 [Saccharibacillus endophyticus]
MVEEIRSTIPSLLGREKKKECRVAGTLGSFGCMEVWIR